MEFPRVFSLADGFSSKICMLYTTHMHVIYYHFQAWKTTKYITYWKNWSIRVDNHQACLTLFFTRADFFYFSLLLHTSFFYSPCCTRPFIRHSCCTGSFIQPACHSGSVIHLSRCTRPQGGVMSSVQVYFHSHLIAARVSLITYLRQLPTYF